MFNRPGVKIMRICISFFFLNCILTIIGGAFLMDFGIAKGNGFFIFLSIVIIVMFPAEAFIIVLPFYCLGQICAHIEDMRNIEKKKENPEYSEKTDRKYGLLVSHYMAQEKAIERKAAKERSEARKETMNQNTEENKAKQKELIDLKREEKAAKQTITAPKEKKNQTFVCDLCCQKALKDNKYDIFYLRSKFHVCPNCLKKLIEQKKEFSFLDKS